VIRRRIGWRGVFTEVARSQGFSFAFTRITYTFSGGIVDDASRSWCARSPARGMSASIGPVRRAIRRLRSSALVWTKESWAVADAGIAERCGGLACVMTVIGRWLRGKLCKVKVRRARPRR
jgi:hypothetical protein